MSRRIKLINSVIHIIDHNRDGSYRTQNDRRKSLISIVENLYNSGFQLEHVKFLKPKHVWFLVDSWKADEITTGTMKNRLSQLRWLLGKLNKFDMMPSNDQLGIEKRQYVTNKDKSRELTVEDLRRIKSPLMQHSLKAQRLFGLRVEESLKIQPFIADQETKLFIKGSWAKGGRDRTIPIRTTEQRAWLDEAKALVKNKQASLIPIDVNYKTYRERFNKACQRAGINHCHGHRHLYAQERFHELTGYACPAKGGPKKSDLSSEQLLKDKEARLELACQLGHSRFYVSNVYLGNK